RRGQGPRPWRYRTVAKHVVTDTRHTRRGRPAKTTPPLNPAAISPVWLEELERIAALAMLTVLGLLVYMVIQRQVRLYLCTQDQQLLGNKGPTATPTAAAVLALFALVPIAQLHLGDMESCQVSDMQLYHLMVCNALDLDHTWYEVADSA